MKRLIFAGTLTSVLVCSCSEETAHGAHWSYEGEDGPEHWGDLSEEYVLAKTGKKQSPIDLTGAAAADVPDLAFNYQATPLRIVNNGHTIQVNYETGSFITIGGERFDLLQFHFHSPSEHTVDGKHSAMELHLVHKSAAGQFGMTSSVIFVQKL